MENNIVFEKKNFVIKIYLGICDKCSEETLVLEMDGSTDEYYNGELCQKCINKLFDKRNK